MANIIQAVAKHRRELMDKENTDGSHADGGGGGGGGSPVKTVLGVLSLPSQPQGAGAQTYSKGSKKSKVDLDNRVAPSSIEDVPFRRQDRRILNARKKRVMDRKLIKFILTAAILLILCGGALIAVWIQFAQDITIVAPFAIIGGVLAFFGLLILFFSIEICIRLRKNAKRVKDPEIDKLTNLHYIKHWMPPELIPYGWGNEPPPDTGGEAFEYNETSQLAQSRGGQRGIGSSIESKSHQNDDDDDDDSRRRRRRRSSGGGRDTTNIVVVRSSNSVVSAVHSDQTTSEQSLRSAAETQNGLPQTAPPQQQQPPNSMALALAMAERNRRRPSDVNSDIFDDSLRYANVDRPSDISIEKSSPTRQRRGTFMTEEERINKIFTPKK